MLVVGPIAEVDLPSQKVIRHGGDSGPRYFEFEVDAFRKHCLLNGLDDIGLTMANMESIRAFEQVRSAHFPWLDGATTRVPKLFAVNEEGEPGEATFPELDTPTPEQWRDEVKARFAARRAVTV